jgi:hypothetical protein
VLIFASKNALKFTYARICDFKNFPRLYPGPPLQREERKGMKKGKGREWDREGGKGREGEAGNGMQKRGPDMQDPQVT